MATGGLLLASPAWAQPRFGEATVKEGSMLLVRGEDRFEYRAGDPTVIIVYGDVVTARPRSRVVLLTVENVELTLGGNSVFQAKPFEREGQRGVLRILFGRLRAKVISLVTGERFSMKTAQSVIGVKGTEFFTSVTAQGDTLVAVNETEHEVSLQGLQGASQALPQGVMSVALNSKAASTPAFVTEPVREQIAVEVLESPPVYAPQAKELPAEDALLKAGVVSEDDLIEAKRDRVTLDDVIRSEERAQPLELRYEIAPESSGDVLRKNFLLSPRR